MVRIHAFNADAIACLVDYASRAICSSHDTGRRVAAAQEAVACSRALIVKVDALIAEATRVGWLWPNAFVALRDIETMSLEEIVRELALPRPSPDLTSVKSHLSRRAQLWSRFDRLTRAGGGSSTG
jgi:hypothetical protein